MVREGGIEPPCPKAHAPKACAYTYSATLAHWIEVNTTSDRLAHLLSFYRPLPIVSTVKEPVLQDKDPACNGVFARWGE